jgi:acyl-CoA synthetase (AMP-forming)/AMP-acid ligase II
MLAVMSKPGPEAKALSLAAAARLTEACLAARGVRAGDVIAVCAPDGIEVTATRCAATSMRAIVVTLSPLSPGQDVFSQLCVSGARWLVTTPDLFARKLEAAARPSAVTGTFLIGSAGPRLSGMPGPT